MTVNGIERKKEIRASSNPFLLLKVKRDILRKQFHMRINFIFGKRMDSFRLLGQAMEFLSTADSVHLSGHMQYSPHKLILLWSQSFVFFFSPPL